MILISVNIHTDEFLQRQLESIERYAGDVSPYRILFNTSPAMEETDLWRKTKTNGDVIVNPIPIEKERFHGSIFEGIASNILYADSMGLLAEASLFVVLSARTVFASRLDVEKLRQEMFAAPLQGGLRHTHMHRKAFSTDAPDRWFWATFADTELYRRAMDEQGKVLGGRHEGFAMDNTAVNGFAGFLREHADVIRPMFALKTCVEEFAPWTIVNMIPGARFCGLFIRINGELAPLRVEERSFTKGMFDVAEKIPYEAEKG